MSRNKREGKYAGKYKMSHGYGRMKHWRTEYDSLSLKGAARSWKMMLMINKAMDADPMCFCGV